MAISRNRFTNYKGIIEKSESDWDNSFSKHLAGLQVTTPQPNMLVDQHNRTLQHFCTTSYLGLDYHPEILEGAISELKAAGTLRIANSSNRCQLQALGQYESELAALFDCECLVTLSCSAASAGILPLVAAGVFTDCAPPRMVFDKFAHYSMNHVKAACADETEIETLPHNDMDRLEDICKKTGRAAYIADGYYSMGGMADLDALLYLKERYGLFLYMDDSHALSTVGLAGKGFVRNKLDKVDDSILVVASLAKSFGASGGMVMMASERQKQVIHRYGGPTNWSQSLNAAAIGAGRASCRLHSSLTVSSLQQTLQRNIQLFDQFMPTEHAGSASPIRLVPLKSPAQANEASGWLASNGFLTSAVFFPVVPKGKAAVRVTLRADMLPSEIESFCRCLSKFMESHAELSSR